MTGCPRCGEANAPEANACGACGERLAPACRGCGSRNPEDARFCNQCGRRLEPGGEEPGLRDPPPTRDARAYTPPHLVRKILTSRSALEGERKQVTVLFADVKGSMELAEAIDPEELHGVMDRFFAILTDGVHRFEGTVNQYTGDGIMALFGAPIAHEDHAQRACHAAVWLRDELRTHAETLRRTRGLGFEVRMGLNSGDVVVGKIGDDLRMDYTAQGQTVGLASRVERLAYPGTAYITESVASLVEGFFELRDLGPFELKGVREPVRVFELGGPGALRTRLDRARLRGLSPFVGRRQEIASLEEAVEGAVGGRGGVVAVVGEGGVGKSRLCLELLERCRGRGLGIYRGHGLAHARSLPFLPAVELARELFGLGERDSPEVQREKIAGRVLLLDASLQGTLPLLFDFVGVPDDARPVPPMDAEARERRLRRVFRRLVQALSERDPLLILLDDLHWFDRASDAFLEDLVEGFDEIRGLLVVNFRPEYRAPWLQREGVTRLDLRPLGPEDVRRLLDELLGTADELRDVAERIVERTGGNPFFVEEVVRSLHEAGQLTGERGAYHLARPVDELSIPLSVQGVLAARIDRLPERDKRTLQTAAVVGRRFSEAVLGSVLTLSSADVTDSLRALEHSEFIHPEDGEGDVEWVFRHPLTQEAAYATQLRETRRRVHADVARTLQDLHGERADEVAPLVAHHWEGAEAPVEAASWHRRAAVWTMARSFPDGARHWRRVRELLSDLDPTPERDALRLEAHASGLGVAWRVGATEAEIESLLQDGKVLAERVGDPRVLAMLHTGYGICRGVLFGDVPAWTEHTGEAMRLAEESRDPGFLTEILAARIAALEFAGRLKEAVTACNLVLDSDAGPEAETALPDDAPTAVFLRLRRGVLWAYLGRLEEAERDLVRGAELARENEVGDLGYWSAALPAITSLIRGDRQRLVAQARASVEVAERLELRALRTHAQQQLGLAHLLAREWDQAAAAYEGVLALRGQPGAYRIDEGWGLCSLAIVRAELGHAAAGRDLAEEALSLARRRGTLFLELVAWVALAWAIARGERVRDPRLDEALGRAEELIDATGGRVLEPLVRFLRAERARLGGDPEAIESETRALRRSLDAIGATGHLADLGDPESAGPSVPARS